MIEHVYGELPTTPVIFAACDSKYFMEHALPFAVSSSKAGFDTHIHVNRPDDEVLSHCDVISANCENKVTFTFDEFSSNHLDSEEKRTFYACLRFFVLPIILGVVKKVLTLDIDCIVMKGFEFPETNYGYFPRPNESDPGMKVAAGAVYMTNKAIGTAEELVKVIDSTPLNWFADQLALSNVFSRLPSDDVTCFDHKFMDWDFIEGTTIWTGKGMRKHVSLKYMTKKDEFKLGRTGVVV